MADTPKAQGKQFGFHGREKEFAWLRGMFDAVATKDFDGKYAGPRMAVIVAESGIGKSRLVQELYIRLTNDPKWDPPEFDYWPEAFGDGGVNLRAVPDMKGHVPKGPPRFAWLGARWQSPEERNALERRSVLPELRSSVVVHAEILKSHGSAWADAASRVSESVRKEGVGESIGAAADLVGIPFFGLMSKLAKGVKDLAADRLAGPKSFEKVEQEEVRSEVDEVLDCMRLLLNGSGAVPTVLWLDDAQWIDAETQAFLHKLWKEAERRKWPLLIAVTHWEREWRELAIAERKGEAGDTLYDFVGKDGVEVQVIDCAETAALRATLLERLPGLKASQQSLLVEKSGGNFLTMMENIGELLVEPAWFESERVDAALTDDAVEHIREFKTNRVDRVRQRFQSLESEVKKILGWSTQIGSRFIAEVVEEFAREKLGAADPARAIERCVDPYVVLAKPSPLLREFRDKVFHHVASEYRAKILKSDSEKLSAALRRHLVEWVNNSFDAEGNEIWPDEEEGIAAPERSATSLGQEERRDLLGMATRELPLSQEPDWSNQEHIAAVRAVYLLIITDLQEGLWDRVAHACRTLAEVPFESMVPSILCANSRDILAQTALDAGISIAAERIGRASLLYRRVQVAQDPSSENVLELLWAYQLLAGIAEHSCDLRAERQCHLDALRVLEAHAAALDPLETQSRRSLLQSMVARIAMDLGDATDEQHAALEQALLDAQDACEREGTFRHLERVVFRMAAIAEFAKRRGNTDEAYDRLEECLELIELAEEESEQSGGFADKVDVLRKLADIDRSRGEFAKSLTRLEQAYAHSSDAVDIEQSPDNLLELAVVAERLAQTHQACRRHNVAAEFALKSLGIHEQLMHGDTSPMHANNVLWSLQTLCRILTETNRASDAAARLAQYEALAVELECARGNHLNLLHTCAAYWQARALASQSLGELERAQMFGTKAARLTHTIAARQPSEGGAPRVATGAADSVTVQPSIASRTVHSLDSALVSLRDAHERLAAADNFDRRRRFFKVSLHVSQLFEQAGDLASAISTLNDGLAIMRRLVEEHENPLPTWESDFHSGLRRGRGLAIGVGDFQRGLAFAAEAWSIAREQVEDDRSPAACEYLLRQLLPLMCCELELEHYEDASESAELIRDFVAVLASAFEDPGVDRDEQQLDSTTLLRCAEGMDLVARLRGAQGDATAEHDARARASELRERAEALKAEEDDAEAEGEADETKP